MMQTNKYAYRHTDHNARMEKTDRNRQICEMRRQGLTFEDIGERFDITMQAASKIYRRDRRKY